MSDRDQDAFQVPDWLSGVGDDLFADVEPETPATIADTPDNEPLPDWLNSLVGRLEGFQPPATILQPPAGAEETSIISEEDLPDWLREEKGSEEPAGPGELPLWLQPTDDRQVLEFGFDMPTAESGSAETAPNVPPSSLPPAESPSVANGDVAAWPAGREDTTRVESRERTEAENDHAEGREEPDTPDWLRELQQMPPVAGPLGAPTQQRDSIVGPVPETTPEAELPIWLRQPHETSSMAGIETEDDIFEAELSDGLRVAEDSGQSESEVVANASESIPAPEVEGERPPVDLGVHPFRDDAFITGTLAPATSPGGDTACDATNAGQTHSDADQVEAALEREARAAVGTCDATEDESAGLRLARREVEAENWPEALALYAGLVGSSQCLDEVISDLEARVLDFPQAVEAYQLLGDAYANKGMLPLALRAYRTALERLHS